jgi:exodeoxyribonuclease VII large subunit
VDFTIADFVADLRAPTPSAAAELVVQNSQNTAEHIAALQKRMLQAVSLFYERLKGRFDLATNSRFFKNPELLTQSHEQELDELSTRLETAWAEKLLQFTHRFEVARQKLNALGPQAVLKRGYSITRKQDGTVISRVTQTAPGETIYVQVQDGMIHTEVK